MDYRERMKQLRDILNENGYRYYVLDAPTMSDYEYDMLNRELEKGNCFSLKQLAVNGNDLLALGLSGPEVGQTLQNLLNQVMDGTLPNRRDALLAAVQKMQ